MAKNHIQNFENALEPEGVHMKSKLRVAQTRLENSTREENEALRQQGDQTPVAIDINEMGGNAANRHDSVEIAPALQDINC